MIDSFNDGPSLSYPFSLLTFSLICIFTIDIYRWAHFCNVTFTLKQKQETFFSYVFYTFLRSADKAQSKYSNRPDVGEFLQEKTDADKNFRGQ